MDNYKTNKYGVLKDKTVVKIHSWTDCDCCEDDLQEIHFYYFNDILGRKDRAWARKKDFIGFRRTKEEAKELVKVVE